MRKSRLSFLMNAFPKHKVQCSDNDTHATIFNPFRDENIEVYYYEDDDFTPFCVCFSFQHAHLTDEEDVIDWIKEIILGNKFAIEFFKNEQRCFGSDIEAAALNDLSYAKLEQYTGYYGMTKLLKIADSFKVRGWNDINNFDATFVCGPDGGITIERSYI